MVVYHQMFMKFKESVTEEEIAEVGSLSRSSNTILILSVLGHRNLAGDEE
jgi:hypothetical protein